MEYLLLLFGGLLAGTVGSLVGLGGGIVIVPLLLGLGAVAVLDVSPQIAVGTSMLTVLFTGLSSTLMYMKHKRIDYKSGLLLFIGSGPGSIFGSWVNRYFDSDSFSLYFGLFMIMIAVLLSFRPRQKEPKIKSNKFRISRIFTAPDGKRFRYGFPLPLAIALGFIVGVISGLFGIGGGSLLVPAMIMLFAFPPHIAVPTSMLVVFLSAIAGSLTHISLGNVDWLFALVLVPGAWFGGRLGAYINTRLSGNTVIIILRIVLVIVGIRLIL